MRIHQHVILTVSRLSRISVVRVGGRASEGVRLVAEEGDCSVLTVRSCAKDSNLENAVRSTKNLVSL